MPGKPAMRETFVDLRFPLQGINTSEAYAKQPQGTTVIAVNCRAFDSGKNQLRGGSRAGLTPFFGAGSTSQVSGFHLIQSISVIVTASESAVG